MNKYRWSQLLITGSLLLGTGCTKRNPDLCCTTDAECAAIGFSSHAPCDLGVCVKNECTTMVGVCDDDKDCAGGAFCVAGTCAACATSSTCPATSPVCDTIAHDCRACAKDSECDSLACDVVAGTCVDPANILYASPNGASTDPCTRAAPCSLDGAAQRVDMVHSYISLLPGRHISGAHLLNKTATIAGNNATISIVSPTQSQIEIDDSDITMRDIIFDEQPDHPDLDAVGVVRLTRAHLTIANLQSRTTNVNAIFASGASSITIANSTFSGRAIRMLNDGSLMADSCFFATDGPSVSGFMNLTNSVINMSSASQGLESFAGQTETAASTVNHNTIIGGKINCGRSTYFHSNIVVNTSISDNSTGCFYTYNLFYPDISVDTGDNLVGDPLFIDSTTQDFHLKPRSPAIDTADPMLITVGHDFDGTPRPQGVRNDIGAFEYVPPAAP